MQQLMKARALRTVGLLFGLSMMLMGCGDLGDLPGAIGGGEPPASEESEPQEEESEVSEESEPAEEESEVSEESEPADEGEADEEAGHDEEDCRNRNHDHDEDGDEADAGADEEAADADQAA